MKQVADADYADAVADLVRAVELRCSAVHAEEEAQATLEDLTARLLEPSDRATLEALQERHVIRVVRPDQITQDIESFTFATREERHAFVLGWDRRVHFQQSPEGLNGFVPLLRDEDGRPVLS